MLRSIVGVRNYLYDKGFFSAEKANVPVISIGNLSMGGTGKSPVIHHLAEFLKNKNVKVGIVSRGYKGSYKGIQVVDSKNRQAASVFGDEPTMLASSLEVPVVVCRKRIDGVRKLEELGCELVLADDGFQHRSLKRDLDVVLLDATEDIQNYRLFPKGRLREPLSSLKRAQVLLVTKRNLISGSTSSWDQFLEGTLEVNGLQNKTLVFADYKLQKFENLDGEQVALNNGKVVLLSAIARPTVFQSMIEANGLQVVKHFSFADHHLFQASELEAVLSEARKQNCPVVMTEKDAVKVRQIQFLTSNKGLNDFNLNEQKIDYSKDQTSFKHSNILVAKLALELNNSSQPEAVESFYGQVTRFLS